jgi:hypothetical protein
MHNIVSTCFIAQEAVSLELPAPEDLGLGLSSALPFPLSSPALRRRHGSSVFKAGVKKITPLPRQARFTPLALQMHASPIRRAGATHLPSSNAPQTTDKPASPKSANLAFISATL